jgi:hypothetical protein
MNANFGFFIFFFLIMFGALEFAIVIIPAIISRSKAKRSSVSEFDIPVVLLRPVPAEHIAKMRAWYFDQNDRHRYIRTIALDAITPAIYGYQNPETPVLPSSLYHHQIQPDKDWKAINNANWAIQRANNAVREAHRAVREANNAVQQAGVEDLGWIDSIAELNQIQFPPNKR